MQQSKESIGFRVAQGAVFSVLRKLLLAPIALFLVPFTLHEVGVVNYGMWAILTTIINFAWLMDPGLGPAVTKHVAEFSSTNDVQQIRRVVNASLAICLTMAVIAAVIAWLGGGLIVSQLFRGPSAPPVHEVMTLWPLVLLCISVFLLGTPFVALINGRQRMDLTNALIFSAELFSATMTVILLLAGAKVAGLLLVQLLTSVFILVGGIIITRRLLPAVVPNPLGCDVGMVRRLLKFSLPLYAGYVMNTLQGQLERLYLARMVGVVSVGWYDVASQGAVKIRRLPDLLLNPVLGGASQLAASKEMRKLEELHFRAHKYLGIIAVPLVVFAIVCAKDLMHLWVGKGLEIVGVPFALLVLGNLFAQISAPTYFVTVGRGILRPALYSAFLACSLNLVLSYVFIKMWGFSGAALGTAIPMTLSTIYFLARSRRYFEMPVHRLLLRSYLKPILYSISAAVCAALIGFAHWSSAVSLIGKLTVFGFTYLILLIYARGLDEVDRDYIVRHMPVISRFRKPPAHAAGSIQQEDLHQYETENDVLQLASGFEKGEH